MLAIYLTFLVMLAASAEECNKWLEKVFAAYYLGGPAMAMNVIPENSILYSGKALNDLGFYDSCLESNMNYVSMQIKLTPALNLFFMGICLPSYCTAQDLTPFTANISSAIQELIPVPGIIVKTLFRDRGNLYPKFDALAGIVATVVVVILILALIGTFLTLKARGAFTVRLFERNTNQRQRERRLSDDQIKETRERRKSEEKKEVKKPDIPPVYIQVLKCFSIDENFRRLISIKKTLPEDDNFKIFNAIRVCSISWVIYGHTLLIEGLGMKNEGSFLYVTGEFGWMTLAPAAYFAVDVFFFIGGFLSCVLMEEKFRKTSNLKTAIIPFSYLHRFIRLWPTYMICLLIFWKLTVYMGDGPIWDEYIQLTVPCDTKWWQNFLLIDNLFPQTFDYCFAWGWYLSNDFQIFLVAPPIMYLFIKKRWLSYTLTWAGFIACLVTSYTICQVKRYHFSYPNPTATPQADYMYNYYYKPYIRAAPYFMGILFGFAYINQKFNEDGKIKEFCNFIVQQPGFRVLMYIIGLTFVSWTSWAPYPLQSDMDTWNQQEQNLYQTFGRVIFLIGVSLLITPALLKVPNDPISIILTSDVFVPLARVSFCVYLVHFMVIMYCYFSARQMIYASVLIYLNHKPGALAYSALPYVFISFFFATLFSLLVESPLMNLEKVKCPRKGQQQPRKQRPKKNSEENELENVNKHDSE